MSLSSILLFFSFLFCLVLVRYVQMFTDGKGPQLSDEFIREKVEQWGIEPLEAFQKQYETLSWQEFNQKILDKYYT